MRIPRYSKRKKAEKLTQAMFSSKVFSLNNKSEKYIWILIRFTRLANRQLWLDISLYLDSFFYVRCCFCIRRLKIIFRFDFFFLCLKHIDSIKVFRCSVTVLLTKKKIVFVFGANIDSVQRNYHVGKHRTIDRSGRYFFFQYLHNNSFDLESFDGKYNFSY